MNSFRNGGVRIPAITSQQKLRKRWKVRPDLYQLLTHTPLLQVKQQTPLAMGLFGSFSWERAILIKILRVLLSLLVNHSILLSNYRTSDIASIIHLSGTRFSWAAIWFHTTELPVAVIGKRSVGRSGCAGRGWSPTSPHTGTSSISNCTPVGRRWDPAALSHTIRSSVTTDAVANKTALSVW